MGKIIAFANQKGGVGKTTSAVNIAAALGAKGKKVLLIDVDPQGNASSAVGIDKKSVKLSTYDVLIHQCTAEAAITKTEFKNLSVIPATISLAGAEFELSAVENSAERNNRLRTALESVKKDFDYIILDCPPSLGVLTVNGLVASDGVVIPMQCEYFALEGLAQLLVTIRNIKRFFNASLEITGILVTMYAPRLNLSVQVMEELKRFYADKLFKTTIARSVRLGEAPSYGTPIQYFDRYSKGSLAYSEVANELMQRI